MSTRLHINAVNYPLPLVRENSIIQPSKAYGGWVLVTDFEGDSGDYRVVFFGDDLEDLKRRLGETGHRVVSLHDTWICDTQPRGLIVRCPECGRAFDLLNPEDVEEYEYGHDCEEE